MSHLAPERFIEEARAALTESSRRLVEDWRLGSESRWEVDLKVGQVSFHFEDGTTLIAPIQVVGTYNSRDGTFLWAWGHKALPEHLVAHASLARVWGQDRGVADYTTAIINCTPDEVWNFAAVTARLAGREGIYRGRNGSVWLYLTYGDIEMQVQHRGESAAPPPPASTELVELQAARLPGPRGARSLGRFSADLGEVVERGFERLQSRIRDVVHRPVDCAQITGKLRLSLARRRGQLEPLDLMPAQTRLGPEEAALNRVYVPPYFAQQKRRIDHLITAGLVRNGIGVPSYVASADFVGDSLVPAAIHIDVAGAMECWSVLRVWEPGGHAGSTQAEADNGAHDANGPDTAAIGNGPLTEPQTGAYNEPYTGPCTEPATEPYAEPRTAPGPDTRPGKPNTLTGPLTEPQPRSSASTLPDTAPEAADDPISEGQPRSIVEAFIRDYFEWNLDAVEGEKGRAADSAADREAQVLREYRALLARYCANGVRPGVVSFGADSRFDPETSRIVAEIFLGDRALVVVGCPTASDESAFSTYDFEFALDDDRWLLVDIAVVDGFDRLSMLKRQRAAALRHEAASLRSRGAA